MTNDHFVANKGFTSSFPQMISISLYLGIIPQFKINEPNKNPVTYFMHRIFASGSGSTE